MPLLPVRHAARSRRVDFIACLDQSQPLTPEEMYSKWILTLAMSVFLAFAGLSPDDVLAIRGERALKVLDDMEALPPASYFADAAAAARFRETSMRVESAVSVLEDLVPLQSHPDALRYAFRAYFNYKATYPNQVRKPYLYFVDFGLDSRTPRGYVFDMDRLQIVEGPFNVAHGRGSVSPGSTVPTRFLNRDGSNATSLGLYLAQETYAFSGKSGGRAYRSVGLRLQGVSGKFNDEARSRGIVVHGAPYVTEKEAGRSEGCPAMAPELAAELIPMIAQGGLVFHFSPIDQKWMKEDPWAALPSPRLAGTAF